MFFLKKKSHSVIELPPESKQECRNVGRGWYHIYTFALDRQDTDSFEHLPFWENETLVLLRFDIGAFACCAISDAALSYAEEILNYFHQKKKDIILRVLYDTQGAGMEKEPSLFSRVLTHMQQLGAIVRSYKTDIFLLQGCFVGNWGEMHGSKFLEQKQIRTLFSVWQEALGGQVRFAVRKPSFCRMILKNDSKSPRIGVFDDAIFGSETHLGTFGTTRQEESMWEEDWCMEDELCYLKAHCASVPFGGEVLFGQALDEEKTLFWLREFRVTYLNCVYDERILNRWKQMPYGQWGNLYTYIGAHLGYRFFAERVQRCAHTLVVVLKNTGFSAICEDVQTALEWEDADGVRKRTVAEFDLKTLLGGMSARIVFPLELSDGSSGHCFLTLTRRRGNCPIYFANEGHKSRLKIL